MYINKNIAISETGFIFNPLSGDSFSTNATGQEILRKLQTKVSFKDLCNHISKTFFVDIETAEKDLTDFIIILKNYQIIIDSDDQE